MRTADFEAAVTREGETHVGDICRRCIRAAQAEGAKVKTYGREFLDDIRVCDWCNPNSEIPGFIAPYVVPSDPPIDRGYDLASLPEADSFKSYFENPCLTPAERNCGCY